MDHRSIIAPIALESIDPVVPYAKISVILNKNPPIKEPITAAPKSPHIPPKLLLLEIMPVARRILVLLSLSAGSQYVFAIIIIPSELDLIVEVNIYFLIIIVNLKIYSVKRHNCVNYKY